MKSKGSDAYKQINQMAKKGIQQDFSDNNPKIVKREVSPIAWFTSIVTMRKSHIIVSEKSKNLVLHITPSKPLKIFTNCKEKYSTVILNIRQIIVSP